MLELFNVEMIDKILKTLHAKKEVVMNIEELEKGADYFGEEKKIMNIHLIATDRWLEFPMAQICGFRND
jgi:NDP-sugar pyrophosphorylase family protein